MRRESSLNRREILLLEDETATTPVYPGSGLGLAISRLLARQLGGDIALASTGPVGTTFRVWVPIAGPSAEPVSPVLQAHRSR